MRIVLKVLVVEKNEDNWEKGGTDRKFFRTIDSGSLIMIEFPLSFSRLRKGGVSSFDIKVTNLDTKDTYISRAGVINKLWSVIQDYEEIYI